MLSGLTASIPIALIAESRIGEIEQRAPAEPTLSTLLAVLRKCLNAVQRPEDHAAMAQAYEAYAEASFWLEMADRGVILERTPGTGGAHQQRPDFVHRHADGNVYFEVKALEIADPVQRHKASAHEALEQAVDLSERAKNPGTYFGEQEFTGPVPTATLSERIDATIDKITNLVKVGQIYFGPTVLVVDLGRFNTMPHGPSNLLPVFFHDGPPAESSVSGELWQIGFGEQGERLFSLPEFDGSSNLAGHQTKQGVMLAYPGLLGVTFIQPRWSESAELFTLWNTAFDQSLLENACTVEEHELSGLLRRYSNGLNDQDNEIGWPYRVAPLRP